MVIKTTSREVRRIHRALLAHRACASLAELVGVSPATVNAVLRLEHKRRRISDLTRSLVLAAAVKLERQLNGRTA